MKQCLCFRDERLWIRRSPAGTEWLFETNPNAQILPVEPLPDGTWAAESESAPVPGAESIGLRELFDLVSAETSQNAGMARQLLHWRRSHRFCSVCAAPLERHPTERAMYCLACGHLAYPRINPVAITLIHRGREVLLARKAGNQYPFWSLIAGFVEVGETLEQTVRREVHEEVGLRVRDIRYATSQAWADPSNLMIGFTASYDGGEILPDGREIEHEDEGIEKARKGGKSP